MTMTNRRLLAVGTVLAFGAVLTCSQLWGEPEGNRKLKDQVQADNARPAQAPDLDRSPFTNRPVVTYKPLKGETLVALQLQPKLEDAPVRARDYLVLVDTSASKANGLLANASAIVKELAGQLGPRDSLSLWTVNVKTNKITTRFLPGDKLKNALETLDKETPFGAANLKDGLTEAVKALSSRNASNQRVILFLGDGRSVANPISSKDRADLAAAMVQHKIAFFPVPLGERLDSQNLHGFANSTGGKLVRFQDGPKQVGHDLLKAVAEPILYPTGFGLSDQVVEFFPTQLPPLRRDVPTLVVGRIKEAAELSYELTGKVAGKEVSLKVTEKVPAPEVENFFLVSIVDQWKQDKEQPALIQADRALAFAMQSGKLALKDMLVQAGMALENKKPDIAAKLFEQAHQLDPSCEEAKTGLDFLKKVRTGELKLDDLKKQINDDGDDQIVRVDGGGRPLRMAKKLLAQQANPGGANGGNNPAAPPNEDALLREARNLRIIADQQQTGIVNEAIRQANRLVQTDPDGAHEFLKRTLDGVRTNPEISPETRTVLGNRLVQALRGIDLRGAIVRRNQADDLAARADADARLMIRNQAQADQQRIKERMRVIHTLMNQAREQDAYLMADRIRLDQINAGLPVPPSVEGAYVVGLRGYHLRENQELRRRREERWLAVLLQVEKSHIPFPDEPPVEYPPAVQWRELSEMRKAKYESSGFGVELPKRAFELRDVLAQTINYAGLDDNKATLMDVLDQLAKQVRASKGVQLTFDINENAFKAEQVMDVGKLEVANPALPPMTATLNTVLKKILSRIQVPSRATYIIRKDTIEITTGQFAVAEKSVRVYPVADLVTPIPNSVNTTSLLQNASVSTIFGSAGFGMGLGMGGIGMGLGINGLGINGLGINGIGINGIGIQGIQGVGINGIQGGVGINGVGGGVGQAGLRGGQIQGQGNLGQGGVAGFAGNLGQFGNLGGQFGLQGGNTSSILTTVIRQVVGRPKDWALNFDPITGAPLNPLDDAADQQINQENNQLGFYPPSNALVVKASAIMHAHSSNLLTAPAGGPVGGGLPPLAQGDKEHRVNVAPFGDERNRKKRPPLPDPKKVYEEALSQGQHKPRLIIDAADALALSGHFDHLVEFLKANLRRGIVVEPWVYKTLAIALRETGAPAEEIERAEVSAADLEPLDAHGYLTAARALSEDGRHQRALAFCRQAALLEPGVPTPYEAALDYAELARDSKSMEWAAGTLLRQDWAVDNQELQTKARQKVEALARQLDPEEANRLREVITSHRRRDLVIKLLWQGDADMDLKVTEPTGSQCWALNRQTVGGGTLVGDTLAEGHGETYLAAKAFPGEYTINVERVWGHPLGNKVQIKIIRDQGTPEEHEQLLTLHQEGSVFKSYHFKLNSGRRSEMAYVPPPSALEQAKKSPTKGNDTTQVLSQLRALADPDAGMPRGLRGGVGTGSGANVSVEKEAPVRPPSSNDRPLYQTRVSPYIQNGVGLTAQATLSADRRYVRLSMTPVFNTVTGFQPTPVGQFVSPIFPGRR